MVRASRSQLPLSSGAIGGDLPEDLQTGPEIAAPEGRVGVGAQRRAGFGDRPRPRS